MLAISILNLIIGLVLFAFPSQFVTVLNLIPKFFPTLRPVSEPVDPLLLSFAAAYLLSQAVLGFWWLKAKEKNVFYSSLATRGILLTLFVLSVVRDGNIFGTYVLAAYELIAAVVFLRANRTLRRDRT